MGLGGKDEGKEERGLVRKGTPEASMAWQFPWGVRNRAWGIVAKQRHTQTMALRYKHVKLPVLVNIQGDRIKEERRRPNIEIIYSDEEKTRFHEVISMLGNWD